MTIGWLKLRIHTLQEWPDRIVEYATAPLLGMWSSSGYDGASGWVQASGKASRRMQGPELADYLLEHRMDRICELDRLYPQRRRLPDVTIEGRAHVSLSMTPAHAAAQTWMIDAQTGLLTKIEGWRRRNGTVAPTSTRLSDYRSIGGAVLPFRLTGDDGEHSYTITVDSVVHGKPVDIAAPPDLPRAPHTPGE